MNTRLLYTAAFSLLFLWACTENEPTSERYTLSFHGHNDKGEATPNIKIRIGETEVGSTAPSGNLVVEVNAQEGDRFPFHVQCPDGHHSEDVQSHLLFRNTRDLNQINNTRIELDILCSRDTRLTALVITAGSQANMPVLVDGVEEGRTDEQGIAHIVVEKEPGTQFHVSLETEKDFPKLKPQNPERMFHVAKKDDILIFQQSFFTERRKKKKRRTRKKKKEPIQSKRPIRIE